MLRRHVEHVKPRSASSYSVTLALMRTATLAAAAGLAMRLAERTSTRTRTFRISGHGCGLHRSARSPFRCLIRGGESGREDGPTRCSLRTRYVMVPVCTTTSPLILSPLTVSSSVTPPAPYDGLKLNPSPAMVPSIGPERPPPGRANPLTFGPSWRRSSHSATFPPPAPPTSETPCQSPVTSTVTSVRSIQSGRATQPEPEARTTAMSSIVPMVLIPRLLHTSGGSCGGSRSRNTNPCGHESWVLQFTQFRVCEVAYPVGFSCWTGDTA
jgi:hypothetical protein